MYAEAGDNFGVSNSEKVVTKDMKHIVDSGIQFRFPTAVTIGKFDTLHLGHQKLILKMLECGEREKLRTVVFSFYPSPAEVLGYEKFPYAFTSAEKIDIFSAPPFRDIDYFIEHPFGLEFSQIEPEDFLTGILRDKMNCKLLVIGDGYRFGKGQKGTVKTLEEAAPLLGFKPVVIPGVTYDGERISSSRIRRLLARNDFLRAEKLMGRPYFIKGYVEHGKMLGRRLGFPTVNIKVPDNKFIPDDGVYVTSCLINGKNYPSISNIGVNPTLGETVKKCETYIFDFEGQLYNEFVSVYFYSFIRGEEKFDDIEALKKRIAEDVLFARRWWEDKNKRG